MIQARPASPRTGLALTVIVIGVLMAAVDTTIVVLALPEMERALHVPLAHVIWVIIGYLLVITLLATQVGRLGDMFGRVRMYQAGFIVFIVGSALCALAGNEATIIGFRLLQGVGGALITANSGAVIADTFPPEVRGRAYGYNSIGWNVGAVLGILLGGLIITYLSWRWIFWINVPTGIFAFILALRVLHDTGRRVPQRLDWPGMVTLGAGLFGVLWAMTQLATGSFSGPTLGFLLGGVVLLVAFLLIERASPAPMVEPSIFRIPTMTPTLLASFFQSLANFAVLFLVIMYLQGVRQLSPLNASLILVPGYLVGGVVGPIAGRLSDRFGVVWPATVGLAVEIVALAVYAEVGVSTPLWVVAVAAVINGIGGGGFFPANNAAVMKVAPGRSFGTASGLLRTFANVGMVFSFTVAILVAARSIPRGLAFAIFVGTTRLSPQLASVFTSGLHAAFYTSMAFMGLAAVLSATRVMGRRRPSGPRGRGAPDEGGSKVAAAPAGDSA
ncbi:MAG: MFS transporter, partial [Candidatus Dormiibacterota bacterium]